MNDSKYAELQEYAREKIKDPMIYDRAMAVCVGIAVATQMPVPSTGIEFASQHYDQVLTHTADTYLSSFNENIVIDIDAAREACRGLWLIRYMAASSTASFLIPDGENFFEIFFGAREHMAADILKFLNTNAKVITPVVNRIISLISRDASRE